MAMNTQTALAGFFADRVDAERAIEDLMDAGFTESDIDFAPYSGAQAGGYAGNTAYLESSCYLNSGGQLGSNSGYASNTDFASGDNAGPNSGYLVTVTGPRAMQARQILESRGADISDRVNPGLAQEGVQRIQLREEELRARKQTVQAGEVHVGKEVVTETRSIDVPVSHDEVVIERHPVTARTASDAPIGQESADIRVPLNREEVTLEKQAYVREEVEVSKRSVTETEHLTDTVRREEARIDNTGDVHVQGETDHRAEMLDEDETEVNPTCSDAGSTTI